MARPASIPTCILPAFFLFSAGVVVRLPLVAADEPKVIELGFEQRVRSENGNNFFDFSDLADDQRNQVRYRTRLWGSIPVSRKITFVAGLNQETSHVIVQRQPYRFDEVIFETAYLDIHDLFVKGLSLRAGRQNLIRGEGAVIFEGDACDGSRTIYTNSAVLTYARPRAKFELVGILDPSRDRFFPRIHDRHRLLTEWDEQALGSYVTLQPRKSTDLESYYFYKKEIHDTRSPSHPQFQPDRHINTAGGRLVHRFSHGWTGAGEVAWQWGADHAQKDIRAWFGYAHLRKEFQTSSKPYLEAGYWNFSGDDPRTKGRIEGWDPIFARWPKWSELYIYSQSKEKGVGYWTNTGMWEMEAGFSLWKPIQWRFTYYRMGAHHPFPGDPRIFGAGSNRGDMVQSRLDFTVNQNWKGHVLYEALAPGDFYRWGSLAYFLRFELIYTFKHHLRI